MAVPEFILKKLIVPNSLKKTSDGLSFQLLNTFAPATITGFDIKLGNELVEKNRISLSSSLAPHLSSTDITAAKPNLIPVGIVITIAVEKADLPTPIRIIIETKEVGPLEFSLSEGKKSKKRGKIRPTWWSSFSEALSSSINLDLGNILGKASPFLLGQFVEHLERCIYDGIWTSDGTRLREDTLDLIKQLTPPIIRYPGGSFANVYHWEDGIGPKSQRPKRHNSAWQAEESNQVGTDEFMAFCREINTEPYLVVNDGSGTPEEAARWVEYCNGSANSEQGNRRAANGHPEPYNVRYWGFGNDIWGPWQIGSTSPEEYSRRLLRFIKAMKAVDPNIIIIAVGNNPLTDDPLDPAVSWNKTILEKTGNEIDYLSWHIYQPEKSGWKEDYDLRELHHAICAAPLDIERIIQLVESQIVTYAPGKSIMQVVDEWNVWLPPMKKNVSMHSVTFTMRDALYVTSVLITFFKHCKTIGMANLAQLVNVLPLIETNNNTALATAIFYPFILFGQMQKNVISYEIESPSYDSSELDINIAAHKSVPYLDGLATVDDSGSKLSIILVNRHPLKRMAVKFTIPDGYKFSPVHAMVIQASSLLAYNTFEKPHQVKICDTALPIMKKGCWQTTLKPASIQFILLEMK